MASENKDRSSQRESVECKGCNKSFTDNKKTIACGRCEGAYCTNCTHFTVAEMSVMKNQALGAIWFCVDCQKPAWKSVKIDKEIDERCQEYFDKMEQRLDELEKKVDKKADDSELQAVSKSLTDTRNQVKLDTAELEQLKKDFKTFEKGEKVQSAIQDAVESEVREWREIDRRKNNIMIYDIVERES